MSVRSSGNELKWLQVMADLARATRIFQQESVFCGGMTFNQYVILDQVARAGGRLRLADLHNCLEVEKSTTTRLVAPLTRQGLLARKRNRGDSRAVELELTDKGRLIRAEVLK